MNPYSELNERRRETSKEPAIESTLIQNRLLRGGGCRFFISSPRLILKERNSV